MENIIIGILVILTVLLFFAYLVQYNKNKMLESYVSLLESEISDIKETLGVTK